MAKFKYILLMLIVAVLFAVFTYSLAAAAKASPEYSDFCKNTNYYPYGKTEPICDDIQQIPSQVTDCNARNGYLEGIYGPDGCVTSWTCNTCQHEYDAANEDFRMVVFLFMSILGVIAIVASLLIATENETVEWLLNGFLLGGLVSLFIGTVVYFTDAPRLLRPFIILVELALVIIIALRKAGHPLHPEAMKKKR